MESELESIVDSARETILKQKRVEILWEVRVRSDTVVRCDIKLSVHPNCPDSLAV